MHRPTRISIQVLRGRPVKEPLAEPPSIALSFISLKIVVPPTPQFDSAVFLVRDLSAKAG